MRFNNINRLLIQYYYFLSMTYLYFSFNKFIMKVEYGKINLEYN